MIKKMRTIAHHPRTNRRLERAHAVVKDYLRMFVDRTQTTQPAVFTYNTSENASTGFTPFKLLI